MGTRIADSTVQAVSGSQKIPVSPDGHITPDLLKAYVQSNALQIEKTWADFQTDMGNTALVPGAQYFISDGSSIHTWFNQVFLTATSIADFDRNNCYATLGAITNATMKFGFNNSLNPVGELEARFVMSQLGTSDPTGDATQRNDFIGNTFSYNGDGDYTYNFGVDILTANNVIQCSGHIVNFGDDTLVGTWATYFEAASRFKIRTYDVFGTQSDSMLSGTVVIFKVSLQPTS